MENSTRTVLFLNEALHKDQENDVVNGTFKRSFVSRWAGTPHFTTDFVTWQQWGLHY